tara:strand:- start:1879 stop:2241 length:363 start_codon:yes stop_codon:yes gene_type:complete
MNKRESLKRTELINIMLAGSEDDMWLSVYELIDITGRLQPSLHRSLHDLVGQGLLIRESRKISLCGSGLPKRYFAYMHRDNKDKQDEIDKNNDLKQSEDEAAAKALGIDVFSYRLNKLIK